MVRFVTTHELGLPRSRPRPHAHPSDACTCIVLSWVPLAPRAGLVPAAVATHLLGKVGGFMLVLQLFMAVTASGAAEQMAVASLVAYDVYRTYFNPQVRYLGSSRCASGHGWWPAACSGASTGCMGTCHWELRAPSCAPAGPPNREHR
jgi:hypothetical protein